MSFITSSDPFNTTKQNFNIHNHQKITAFIYYNYFSIPIEYNISIEECLTCKVDFQRPLRQCYKDGRCKFQVHLQYNVKKDENGKSPPLTDEQTEKYICVVTKQSKKDPLSIYVRRWLLPYNYYNKLEFIMRTANSNGLMGHHKNRKSYDDRLINMVIVNHKNHKHDIIIPFDDPLVKVIRNQVPNYIKEGKIYSVHPSLTRLHKSTHKSTRRLGSRPDSTSYNLV